MVIKNVHLFYFSPTYTTKTVKAIAEGLGAGFVEHDLTFHLRVKKNFIFKKMRSLL